MKYWFDTEFNDTVDPVELISIGIVAEDGREFYAISTEFNPDTCNDWVKTHVLPHLGTDTGVRPLLASKKNIAESILAFLGDGLRPEFWGYYADYDWYLLTRLYGTFHTMPKQLPFLCLDLKQYALQNGVRELPKALKPEHHALVDARWTRLAWEEVAKVESARLLGWA